MFVKSLIFEAWEGVLNQGGEIETPTWEVIATHIRALDGNRSTLVLLMGDGEVHMAVGGGRLAQYIVYATFDGVNFAQLHSQRQLQNAAAPARLNVGGQEGDYPAKVVVSLEEALQAAYAFSSDGTLQESFQWRL